MKKLKDFIVVKKLKEMFMMTDLMIVTSLLELENKAQTILKSKSG